MQILGWTPPKDSLPYQAKLTWQTDAIDYSKVPETNNHNEAGVTLAPGHDTFVDDDTTVWFSCSDKFCNLDIAVNSEVGVSLYNDGLLRLVYDRATAKWSMKAYQQASGGQSLQRNWQFCSPQTAVAHVLSILTYLHANDEKEAWSNSTPLETIAQRANNHFYLTQIQESIQAGQVSLVQGASLYTQRSDCSAPPPAAQPTTPFDGERHMPPLM